MELLKLKKNFFYHNKTPNFLKNVDIDKVLVSNKISFGEKTLSTLLVTCIYIHTYIRLKNLLKAYIKNGQDQEILFYKKQYFFTLYVTFSSLTYEVPVLSSYRNQSVDWFLHEGNTGTCGLRT